MKELSADAARAGGGVPLSQIGVLLFGDFNIDEHADPPLYQFAIETLWNARDLAAGRGFATYDGENKLVEWVGGRLRLDYG